MLKDWIFCFAVHQCSTVLSLPVNFQSLSKHLFITRVENQTFYKCFDLRLCLKIEFFFLQCLPVTRRTFSWRCIQAWSTEWGPGRPGWWGLWSPWSEAICNWPRQSSTTVWWAWETTWRKNPGGLVWTISKQTLQWILQYRIACQTYYTCYTLNSFLMVYPGME